MYIKISGGRVDSEIGILAMETHLMRVGYETDEQIEHCYHHAMLQTDVGELQQSIDNKAGYAWWGAVKSAMKAMTHN